MKTFSAAVRRTHLVVAAVLALTYTVVTGLLHPQPAAAAAKFAQPISGATWQAGEVHSIIWSDASPGRQPLRLLKGDPRALQQVMVITDVDGASGQYAWTIPTDVPPGSDYAIALGTPPDVGYTGQFAIMGAGAAAPVPPRGPDARQLSQ